MNRILFFGGVFVHFIISAAVSDAMKLDFTPWHPWLAVGVASVAMCIRAIVIEIERPEGEFIRVSDEEREIIEAHRSTK